MNKRHDKSAAEQAAELQGAFIAGKEIHDIFSKNIEAIITIDGKSLQEWEDYFDLTFSTKDFNYSTCIEFSMKLGNLYHEASSKLNRSNLKQDSVSQGIATAIATRTSAIYDEYELRGDKRPAASAIDKIVQSELKEILAAQTVANTENKFWKKILDNLNFKMKCLDMAAMQLMSEAKWTGVTQKYQSMIPKNTKFEEEY